MKAQHHRHNASAEKNDSEKRMQAGIRRGITAWFDVGGSVIEYWASAWTGREIVRVDGQVVSARTSWRFTTSHPFEHRGIPYKLIFRMNSLLRGSMEIELYREGELIDSDSLQANSGLVRSADGSVDWKRSSLHIVLYFGAGAILGAAGAWLGFNAAGWFQ